MIRIPGYRRLGTAFALLLLIAGGCASARTSGDSALAPAMVLERFLRAANSNDLDTMARLFGSREGTLDKWSKKDLDERMFAIASVIRHSDYQILAEQIVPGRRDEATQFLVRMQIPDGRYEVPFIMVQSKQGWLVEYVPLRELTNRRGGTSR